jgi:hypothetical protein
MPKKNKMGRPPIIDRDTLNKLEQAYANGATDVQACFYAEINPRTLYKYQEKHPDFVHRKEALKQQLGLIAKNKLAARIKEGDVNDAKWYLERRERDLFSTQVNNNKRLVDKDGEDLHSKDLEVLKRLGLIDAE